MAKLMRISVPISADIDELRFQKQQIVLRLFALDLIDTPEAQTEHKALCGILNILDHIQDTFAASDILKMGDNPDHAEEYVFGPKCPECGEFNSIAPSPTGEGWYNYCHNGCNPG